MQAETRGSNANVCLPPQIDLTNSKEVKQSLLSLYESNYKHITLDFSGVTIIDSSGISTLLLLQKKLTSCGGELIITNVNSSYVKKVFDMLQLHKFIQIQEQQSVK